MVWSVKFGRLFQSSSALSANFPPLYSESLKIPISEITALTPRFATAVIENHSQGPQTRFFRNLKEPNLQGIHLCQRQKLF